MHISDIHIDPELASLCPPLTPDEHTGLEAAILAEGCRDALVVWDTGTELILLDGHNRLEICKRHGKECSVKALSFEDKLGAMLWVLQNQRSRRNLTDDQRAMLADQERKLLSKQAVSEGRKQNIAARWGYESAASADSYPEQPRDTRTEAAERAGVSERKMKQAKAVSEKRPDLAKQVVSGEMPLAAAVREIKREEIKAQLEDVAAREVKAIQGLYDVIVIDPPWPMEKIERDVRPNQAAFDYPTMSEAELSELVVPTADDCHVWLWTTHKFLPMALRLLDRWGLKYVCAFVWHKPGGFQPIGLPQYNCEFCLYARKGSPRFIDTKAFSTCFEAPRGAHSEKPEAFYDIVRRVTAGRRLDMFNRRHIEGFDSWGKEATDE